MGQACAARLEAAGFDLLGFDVDPERRGAFVGPRRAPAASIRELAGCDAVVLCVFDTAQVEAVVEGEGGLQSAAAPGRAPLVVCTSTCDPDRIQALAARCAQAHLPFIEMPISGTSVSLTRADAVGLVAGGESEVAWAGPLLNALCPTRHFLGAPGNGSRAKLAVNLVLGLNRAAMAEGLVFAERLGLAPERFLSVLIGSAAYSRVMEVKGTMMATRRFEPPQSKVDQSLKDFRLIIDKAREKGQPLPFSDVYAELLESCMRQGEAARDNALIVEAIARRKQD